jgi:hypothetical protein
MYGLVRPSLVELELLRTIPVTLRKLCWHDKINYGKKFVQDENKLVCLGKHHRPAFSTLIPSSIYYSPNNVLSEYHY